VWNWVDKTWGIRELTNVTYGAFGQVSVTSSITAWSGAGSLTWAAAATAWSENEYSPAEARLLLSHSTPMISLADTGTTDFGSIITATLERSGMSMGEPDRVKLLRAIYPVIDGVNGSTVSVQVGASMFPDSPPAWQTAQTFTIGTDVKIDSFTTGRYLSIRFSNADYSPWRIRSFRVDYVGQGFF
jgi:hypothetical protein